MHDDTKIIDGRARDLGGLWIRRVLPAMQQRMVGPYVFLDHIGPTEIGQGLSVRSHPHIGLATVTYLYRGEILHRDSVGAVQVIRPGAVNWMTAGRGIVHSERPVDPTKPTPALHGLQMWVALPEADEDVAPAFQHVPATEIPEVTHGGATLRILAGTAYGETSPVRVYSPLFQVDVALAPGSEVAMPDDYAARGIYVAEGAVVCGAHTLAVGQLAVLPSGSTASIRSDGPSRVMLIGGADIGPRYLDWNFVSASPAKIAAAKALWRSQDRSDRFPMIPSDADEFIPLPD